MLQAQADLAGLGKFVDVPNKKLVHEDDHFLAVDNLRVVAVDNPAPTDNVPAGLFFTSGTFSENLRLIDDARVDLVASFDDPAENDNSTLRSSLSFGAVDGQTGADRVQHDKVELIGHQRFDDGGTVRADVQQDKLQQVTLKASADLPNLLIKSFGKNGNAKLLSVVAEGDHETWIDEDGDLFANKADLEEIQAQDIECETVAASVSVETVAFECGANKRLKITDIP